jgi:hypothetical protein
MLLSALMMDAETVSETLGCNSILTWLISLNISLHSVAVKASNLTICQDYKEKQN